MTSSKLQILGRLGVVAGLGGASLASGAIVINNSSEVAPSGGAVHDPYSPSTIFASSTDLAQGLTPTVVNGNSNYEFATGESAWTDGSLATVYNESGPGGDDIDHAAYGAVATGTVVTYDLGGLFDLSQIDVIMGWNDSGRDDASFNALVSTDGISFSQIASYDKGTDNTGTFTTPITSLHRIVDDGGGTIATGVQFVQLQFTDADNGVAGMVELDVIGQAVPEPASAGLVALSGLVFFVRRRRA
ncbi:PEP-CTERM sorting domain-containing protein [Haloferula sargassicola]|uniref:PEP-CTERM protein-sorting domain-containing protein n=1 Tax=Haloferula sargassicola TaxID=490096 RepID=A0ABP9UKP9_9BACT